MVPTTQNYHFFDVAPYLPMLPRLMNEIVNGIKVIKMYTWEKSFTDMVAEARK